MKTKRKLLIPLLAILLALLLPTTAFAAGPGSPPADKIVLGDNYTLESGDTLDENLLILGGNVDIEDGATVNGNITVLGGNLEVSGEVNGDISAAGGNVQIYSSAVVDGDVSSTGASLDVDPEAQISGSVKREVWGPFEFTPNIPAIPSIPSIPGISAIPRIGVDFNPFTHVLWFLVRLFAFSALAVLVVLFIPKPTRQVAQTIITQPVVSGAMGLLTLVVVPLALVIMAVTLILIPVSLVGVALLGVMIIYGWIGLGLEVGDRLSKALKQTWAEPIAAGVGTFLLTLVVLSIGEIDCIGWVIPLLVTILGLGAVLLSRFGSRSYPLAVAAPPAGPVPSVPAVPAEIPPSSIVDVEPSGEVSETPFLETPMEPSDVEPGSDEPETP